MFSGIITSLAVIDEVIKQSSSLTLHCTWKKPLIGVEEGESLSLNGICLTVTKVMSFQPEALGMTPVIPASDESTSGNLDSAATFFEVDVSIETLEKTTAKNWKNGDLLNVERALKYSDVVGGHLVSGHIDGVGKVSEISVIPANPSVIPAQAGIQSQFTKMTLSLPKAFMKHIVSKGSLAVDGVSLTINKVLEKEVELMFVPFTLQNTNLGTKQKGDLVNVELDMIGKYVAKHLEDIAIVQSLRGVEDDAAIPSR
ncbi:MAG: riboflavin synthase [Deltaproteobacteria bacterium]|nr:riboflavin synthase [Deltaproteobacteria bacterium]